MDEKEKRLREEVGQLKVEERLIREKRQAKESEISNIAYKREFPDV